MIVDRGAGQVWLRRSRFPFPPSEQGFDLSEVHGAELQTLKGRGETYRVALVVVGDGRARGR